MSKPVSPGSVAASLEEYWSPRVVAELDDSYVKVAKVLGSFGGTPTTRKMNCSTFSRAGCALSSRMVPLTWLRATTYVVPKGVRHNPVAEDECHVMLIERKSTRHTGSQITERTRSLEEQLRR